MDHASIERFRRFNRFVTQRAGALEASYLGRGRPLGEARLIFEIGPQGGDLKRLRTRLGLDSGYLSRLLVSLESQGLLRLVPAPQDGRRRKAVLTEAGLREHRAYDRLSDTLAHSVLDKLAPAERERLLGAMDEVLGLMAVATTGVEEVPGAHPEVRACLDAYFRELDARFEGGFDIAAAHEAALATAASDIVLLARTERAAVGCATLREIEAGIGEVKRMWVAPEARGRGVARRLLAALEERARRAGFALLRLDTNGALGEARALYLSYGYREIERYNDNPYAQLWFEKPLG